MPDKPVVVTICGSTRFRDQLNAARRAETLAGHIVLSSEVYFKDDPDLERMGDAASLRLKEAMDELHLRKIDLSDEVLILNVGGYIGESTRREWDYALRMRKRVRFLEPRGRYD